MPNSSSTEPSGWAAVSATAALARCGSGQVVGFAEICNQVGF
jgi:hypothetical protein